LAGECQKAKDYNQAQTPAGHRFRGIALMPDGKKLYAANGLSNNFSVIEKEIKKYL